MPITPLYQKRRPSLTLPPLRLDSIDEQDESQASSSNFRASTAFVTSPASYDMPPLNLGAESPGIMTPYYPNGGGGGSGYTTPSPTISEVGRLLDETWGRPPGLGLSFSGDMVKRGRQERQLVRRDSNGKQECCAIWWVIFAVS